MTASGTAFIHAHGSTHFAIIRGKAAAKIILAATIGLNKFFPSRLNNCFIIIAVALPKPPIQRGASGGRTRPIIRPVTTELRSAADKVSFKTIVKIVFTTTAETAQTATCKRTDHPNIITPPAKAGSKAIRVSIIRLWLVSPLMVFTEGETDGFSIEITSLFENSKSTTTALYYIR